MFYVLQFRQALNMAVEQACMRHQQATGTCLVLPAIASDVGIQTVHLEQALDGSYIPSPQELFLLLYYLGCTEREQDFLFHLAELACQEEKPEVSTEQRTEQLFHTQKQHQLHTVEPHTERLDRS